MNLCISSGFIIVVHVWRKTKFDDTPRILPSGIITPSWKTTGMNSIISVL